MKIVNIHNISLRDYSQNQNLQTNVQSKRQIANYIYVNINGVFF